MPQPRPDCIDVDAAAQHMDGSRVANVVRADPLGLYGWHLIACHLGVVGDETVDAESRHGLVRATEEDDLISAASVDQLFEQGHHHRPKHSGNGSGCRPRFRKTSARLRGTPVLGWIAPDSLNRGGNVKRAYIDGDCTKRRCADRIT
jgi:hypothetical protein